MFRVAAVVAAGQAFIAMPYRTIDSPFGPLTIEAKDGAIIALEWRRTEEQSDDLLLVDAAQQLSEYVAGARQSFDLPLAPEGGPLQQAVMQEMRAIPFGETRSYGDIAKAVGAPAQAIGQACGANPIPVIIPCHRVTGSDGLGGFSGLGGVETKVALLRHEGAYSLLI